MNSSQHLSTEIELALAEIPVLDAHTHLVGGRLGARGLHDILLYHMLISDLYAAGCPNGSRLTEFPGWPSPQEARSRILEALPFIPRIRNTSMSWGLRLILADLYGWREPITAENWERLDAQIRERADDQSWQYSILDRAGIRRSCTEYARRGNGQNAERLQYALEWAFFTRCQWGEYDTALYELERCWGRPIESPTPISGRRQEPERSIRTLSDVHSAVQSYIATIPFGQVISTAIHISTDIEYQPVTDTEMHFALARRAQAGESERSQYASCVNELFLSELEKHGNEIVLQFSLGAEPLPYETASRISQRTIAQLGDMVARHPRLRFQCFLSSRHANQALCILARELPNLSLAGCWWHNFFPDVIRQVFNERLDMLPVNKQIAFFSDAYCLEWSYGKLLLVRKILAEVLAERIERGQYSLSDALSIAREILFETPQSLLGMQPVG
jgi:glucuronate isomerase